MTRLRAGIAICGAFLFGGPGAAMACSCFGTASIETAIARQPLLLEVTVLSRREYEYDGHHGVLDVTVRVTRVLKGSLNRSTVIVQHSMCYASLYPGLMEVGHTYVIPVDETPDGHMEMAHCAHSGFELAEGNLYTFEQTVLEKRRLQFYRKYASFLRDFPDPSARHIK